MTASVSAGGQDAAVLEPPPLGRGVIVGPGAPAPGPWENAPRVVLDDVAGACDALHEAWSRRQPVVVELRMDPDELRAPEVEARPPHALDPHFEFTRERCYFLARANNYDGRGDRLAWGPAIEARRLGAIENWEADVTLPDGTAAWCDGGPRGNAGGLVHRNTIEQGQLTLDMPAQSTADLAPDQLDAVMHDRGPARVIAPAGSGKTRVLTERFRLLLARNWSAASITAVAYNVRAKDTMQARLPSHAHRRVRTLHSLGNDIVRRANRNLSLVDEWEMRRRIEALVPVRPKANTDVYAPYLEALGEARLGLVDPHRVEQQRDDVDGFGQMLDEYREKLYADAAIDHDEQIYGAIEVLLREPGIRREVQKECRHLLVDEFQDLTPAQLLMLRLIAAPAYDVFGVGDDDQVIYGYAGADPEFLIGYDRYFPGGTHHALHTNYRCPEPVVDAVSNLLSYNARRIDKEIVAAKSGGELTIERTPVARLGDAAIQQATRWFAAGAQPTDVAVLSRVNATLLAVQILFGEAGVPCWTPVSVSVLNRTGCRAALAYLRLAVAAPAGSVAGADVAIAARRPSRSVRREVLQRFERRRQVRLPQLSREPRLDGFSDDVEALGRALAEGATTAELLMRVRDHIGLGAALATLDLSGKGPDASHRDDLNALIAVASFEPDPSAFEPWLRARLRNADERRPDEGVAVSTVHRVKGMEWPYVIVLGAHDGLMPHALADDLEEERRIFHVAITRGDRAVHVVADAQAAVPFLDQLRQSRPANYRAPERREEPKQVTSAPQPTEALAGTVDALKKWRKQRATADRVPAYVVLSDTHLAGIATRAPATLDELARCPGIGPTKLERYGDEILAVIADTKTTEAQ